jgi:hypothetical protein
MSVREMIRIIHEFDADRYLSILQEEHNATEHPSQPEAFMVDGLPIYRPGQTDEYVYVVSFNHRILPGVLIDSLANHSELVPDEALIFWSIEQKIFLESTMGEQRGKNVDIDLAKREEWREKSQTWILLL